jgi:glycosyltransferase involved in cell wall biosynthesis
VDTGAHEEDTKRPRRILIHDFAGHAFQLELSRELARRGHWVHHVYAASNPTPKGAMVRVPDDPPTLSIHGLDLPGGYRRYNFFRRFLDERRLGHALAAEIKKFSPDIVLSGNAPLETQKIARRASAKAGARFVYCVQDLNGPAARSLLGKRLGSLGAMVGIRYIAMERHLVRGSDGVVAIAPEFADYFGGTLRLGDRVIVIENWAPLSAISPRNQRNAWSNAHDLAGRVCFLYAGMMGLKHNGARLVDLAEHLKRIAPDARVVVATEGLGRELLEAEKSTRNLDTLLLVDFVRPETVADMLGSAAVCIATLEPEAANVAIPSKVLSYMAAGRAILLAMPDQNPIARRVREIGCGLVIDPGDSASFIAAADSLLTDKTMRDVMGQRARDFALAHFAIGPIADRFDGFFEHIISKPLR